MCRGRYFTFLMENEINNYNIHRSSQGANNSVGQPVSVEKCL